MPSRWRWPPENSCAYLRMRSGRRPTRSNRLGHPVVACRGRAAMPKFSSGSPTIVPADRRGLSDEYGSWKTIWMRRRCAHMAPALSAGDVLAAQQDAAGGRLDQLQHRSCRWSTCRSPNSPTRPRVSPCAMEKLTPSTALHRAALALQQAATHREVLDEILDLEARRARSCRRSPRARPPSRRRGARRRHRRAAAASHGSARSRSRSAARRRSRRSARVSDGTMPGISCSRGRVPAASASMSSRGSARIRPRV